jgi:hypothetical protein
MTYLTWTNTHFVWSDERSKSCETLQQAFTTTPILQPFDYDWEIIVQTHASDYISAGVLLQYDNEGILHPVAFFCKQHS